MLTKLIKTATCVQILPERKAIGCKLAPQRLRCTGVLSCSLPASQLPKEVDHQYFYLFTVFPEVRNRNQTESGLVNAGVNLAAGLFAEKLGLKSDNSLVQTAVFVVTKAAILEGAQLIGIGGGLAKGDLAKIMKKEEVI